jgi:hypothetical protein
MERRQRWTSTLQRLANDDQTLRTLNIDGLVVALSHDEGSSDGHTQWIRLLNNNTSVQSVVADDVGICDEDVCLLFSVLCGNPILKVSFCWCLYVITVYSLLSFSLSMSFSSPSFTHSLTLTHPSHSP